MKVFCLKLLFLLIAFTWVSTQADVLESSHPEVVLITMDVVSYNKIGKSTYQKGFTSRKPVAEMFM